MPGFSKEFILAMYGDALVRWILNPTALNWSSLAYYGDML